METMVFGKGRMAVHGQLQGQNWFAFKPPLVTPAIMKLHRVMSLGHIEDGVMERNCAKERKHPYWSQKKIFLATRSRD
jgi:hypothetical protein